MANEEFMRFLAAWALVHETADEGWKSAVTRGTAQAPGEMGEGAEAFVDGLSAMIAEEKERLKASLAEGSPDEPGSRADVATRLDDLLFEVRELRGRLESMQGSLDALLAEEGEQGEHGEHAGEAARPGRPPGTSPAEG